MQTSLLPFSKDVLRLDAGREVERISLSIRESVFGQLRRRGTVICLSGGVDSSVVAALCVRALGKDRVFGLLMPESESSPESLSLGRLLAEGLGIATSVEDITPILTAAGCYRRRDEAIQTVIPEYAPGYRSKIVVSNILDRDGFKTCSVVVESPQGAQRKARLSADAFHALLAATSFKQRARKMLEYYYADRLQYAVAGTPNRLEYDQGFFVKHGDGAADLKPIAHLYKTQVYQLAEFLDISGEIRHRPPTTDTYSLPQSQEEFYFSVPYDVLDLCLYALDHGVSPLDAAAATNLTLEQVRRVYRDIQSKRHAGRYLNLAPLLVGDTPPNSTGA